MEHATDDEIMCKYYELQSRIDRAIEEQQKAGNSLEPAKEVDVLVESFADELQQLCHTKVEIKVKINPTPFSSFKYTAAIAAAFKGAATTEVGKPSEITVLASVIDGKPTEQKYVVECHLKSLVDGFSSKCKVDPIKGHEYRIQYTPTVRGRHELSVTVNGVEVTDSPFPVFASIHPDQLGKPVRVMSKLDHIGDIACNSEGNIIICEFEGDVVLMDKMGNKLSSIKKSDLNFQYLLGVVVDGEDNIYFVDEASNIIYKSDKWFR